MNCGTAGLGSVGHSGSLGGAGCLEEQLAKLIATTAKAIRKHRRIISRGIACRISRLDKLSDLSNVRLDYTRQNTRLGG
jgi:hypothetical protein